MTDSRPNTNILANNLLRTRDLTTVESKFLYRMLAELAEKISKNLSEQTGIVTRSSFLSMDRLRSEAMGAVLLKTSVIVPLSSKLWGASCYLLLDGVLLNTLLEALFGAKGQASSLKYDRPPGTLDYKIAGLISSAYATALEQIFSQNEMSLEIGAATASAKWKPEILDRQQLYSASFEIGVLNQTGKASLLIPREMQRSMLEHRQHEISIQAEEIDPTWERKFRHEVGQTFVGLEAMVSAGPMALKDLTKFKVGHILELPDNAMQRVSLSASGKPLFTSALGKNASHYALKLNRAVEREDELITK